jgi:hypothetical protein
MVEYLVSKGARLRDVDYGYFRKSDIADYEYYLSTGAFSKPVLDIMAKIIVEFNMKPLKKAAWERRSPLVTYYNAAEKNANARRPSTRRRKTRKMRKSIRK